ncbi:MAG: DUF420 domain-containing protein [Calditrichaceae bacterium]|nr:DUF420 domain-containing protein [Calditrichia bacterium]NUQ40384.1 DUF420 domain-containing protein [Calditrichaceae bacterium]
MLSLYDLPALNAFLNSGSFALLLSGFFFIKRGKIAAHKRCMIAAFTVSVLFLISYLVYHYQAGSVRFTGEGWIRPVYFTILISHTLLAMAVPPLAAVTLFRALKERFARHKQIARWTLPVWMYVSVTGVVIYWMLYQL